MNELFPTYYGSGELVPWLRAARSMNRSSIPGRAEVALKRQMVCDLRPYHGNSNSQ
jgi:hypothetical protein